MKFTSKAWTVEEEQEMLASLRKRETFEKIARQHERSTNAIKLRFGMICKKQLESTSKNLTELSQEYRLPEQHLVQYMDDLENIKKKNQTASLLSQQPISSFDLADVSIIKEEILVMNEKLDKIYKYVKKLMEISKQNDVSRNCLKKKTLSEKNS